jgi:Cysteine-rich secretory protein family
MAVILPELPKVEAAIIEITNTVRTEAKLGTVAANPALTVAARAYATFLAKSGKFSHDADGSLSDRTERSGYRHCTIAENLASFQDSRGFESRALAKSAMEGWLNSPGHRQNLMSPPMTEIGVAVAKTTDKDPKFILVQLFGRPQSLSLTFQVSNSAPQAIKYRLGDKLHDLPPKMAITHETCAASQLTFIGPSKTEFGGAFTATDAKTYTVKAAPTGLTVDVTQRQTVK